MEKKIIDACVRTFGITMLDFQKVTRKRNIVECRQIACYLLRKKTMMPLNKIGKLVGSKDHATVLYSINNVENLIVTNFEIREKVNYIELLLAINRQNKNLLLIEHCRNIRKSLRIIEDFDNIDKNLLAEFEMHLINIS